MTMSLYNERGQLISSSSQTAWGKVMWSPKWKITKTTDSGNCTDVIDQAKSLADSGKVTDFIAERSENEQFIESLRKMMLQVIDRLWVDHLEYMDFLRTSVGLKSYGQQEPIVEYKKEGLIQFRALEDAIERNIKAVLTKMVDQVEEFEAEQKRLAQVEAEAAKARESSSAGGQLAETKSTNQPVVKSTEDSIGRNDFVTLVKGSQTQSVKFKKAAPLLQDGWQIKK